MGQKKPTEGCVKFGPCIGVPADRGEVGKSGDCPHWPSSGQPTQITLRRVAMNRFAMILKSFVLSLAFVGAAFASAGKVDINTADAATIAAALNGVGPAKAEAIVAYRTEHGPFKSIDQLVEVRGIGLATVDKNRELIVLGGAK
jgi:competence protein ComEA